MVIFVLIRFVEFSTQKSKLFSLSEYNPPMDLVLLVDSSSAVDWSGMQGLLKGYVETRRISFDDDHIGIAYFASSGQVALPFPTSRDYKRTTVLKAIDDLKQQGGVDRRIDLGLQTVANDFFVPQKGARRDADQVKNLSSSHHIFFDLSP